MSESKGKQRPANEYDDIPGTYVFDADRARQGYFVNKFLYSLIKEQNREAFKADEPKYLDGFAMTEAQRQAVLTRNWNLLLELGAVSYAIAKLAFTDGRSYQFMAAEMTGMTQQGYLDMMVAGGRSPEGWRYKKERGEA